MVYIPCIYEVSKVLSAILETDSEIDRDKEHFWIIGVVEDARH